ncbi:unnamed protein product [Prorocentrum cordatum]|uniref:Uncharacterized protein n=1 Tax=Prorocentrum cordatum TaxID=2364126 RepID=A0ABN9SX73_9DINO|nr:unnamed protein product [Polarella glacialis]
MPRWGVGPLPRPRHSSPTRQPSATPQTKNKINKKKIKTPAKTAINPHGSVVAVVFDVSELVLVSVVVVAVLMVMVVVLDVAERVPVSAVVVAVLVVVAVVVSVVASVKSSTYAEPHVHGAGTGALVVVTSAGTGALVVVTSGPHHHAGPVGAHGHRGTEKVEVGPITRHKLQQSLAGGPVEHVHGAGTGALTYGPHHHAVNGPHHHAGPVGAHGHRLTEIVVVDPITRHEFEQLRAAGRQAPPELGLRLARATARRALHPRAGQRPARRRPGARGAARCQRQEQRADAVRRAQAHHAVCRCAELNGTRDARGEPWEAGDGPSKP